MDFDSRTLDGGERLAARAHLPGYELQSLSIRLTRMLAGDISFVVTGGRIAQSCSDLRKAEVWGFDNVAFEDAVHDAQVLANPGVLVLKTCQ